MSNHRIPRSPSLPCCSLTLPLQFFIQNHFSIAPAHVAVISPNLKVCLSSLFCLSLSPSLSLSLSSLSVSLSLSLPLSPSPSLSLLSLCLPLSLSLSSLSVSLSLSLGSIDLYLSYPPLSPDRLARVPRSLAQNSPTTCWTELARANHLPCHLFYSLLDVTRQSLRH
jgi:hypothetical protein